MLLDPARWSGRIASGGWVETAGAYPVQEPATGAELGRLGLAERSDVQRAAASAAEAQRAWSRTSYEERAAVLRRAGELWERHSAEVQGWLVSETGSVLGKAAVETHTAAQECYEAAALASRPYGELLRSAQPRLSMAQRVPAGVVGVIAPFNFPLILAIRSAAPALALGNAVLLKPDQRTAVSGGVSIARVFQEAGLPEGLLHVLPGGADVGTEVVTDPRVRVVSFTGSTTAGRAVGELAGRHLKRVHLELGGNSALVVLDDADAERAAAAGAWGSFLHQGQICMTTGRHLVHESVAERYVDVLTDKARRLTVGDPSRSQVALGPVIDAHQRDHIHELVTGSVEAGATVTTGGTYERLYYRPTVLADAAGTPAYAEEVFGPIAPVATFASLDEAAALAADSEYGLSLGIVTRDVTKGLELADRVPTGIVHINDQTVSDEAVIPFGGVGNSGTGGRFGGDANLDAFTETRWITMRDRVPAYPF